MKTYTLPSPFGNLHVEITDGKLTRLKNTNDPVTPVSKDPEFLILKKDLAAYFKTGKPLFNLPLSLQGTAFQKKVWAALLKIPCGEVATYSQIAKRIGSGPRAVGNACRANPIALIVPCHRVVAQNGLGGYAGKRGGPLLDQKSELLHLEGFLT